MAPTIEGAQVAFLVAHEGVEQIELTRPWHDIGEAGGVPRLVSTARAGGTVQAFEHLDRADTFDVDAVVSDVGLDDYQAVVLPGGVANPDALRLDDDAVTFVRGCLEAGKPVAAICHAGWMLAEAGGIDGRRVTSWPSLATDLVNAGATWVDQEVVVCDHGPGPLVTSRKPDDLDGFCRETIAAIAEARVTA